MVYSIQISNDNLKEISSFRTHVTCNARLIILDLITLVIVGEAYELLSVSLCDNFICLLATLDTS
jgi:hypothetical protein